MDKRTLLALVLMALVIVVTPMLFPSSRRSLAPADSTAAAEPLTAASPPVTITYQPADGFRTAVHGKIANAPAGSSLLIDLPRDLRSAEADTLDDLRHLAYGYKLPRHDVTSVPFAKLDTTVRV